MTTARVPLWPALLCVALGELAAVVGAYDLAAVAHRWLLTGHADGLPLAIGACCLVAGIVCLRLGFWRVVDAVTDWVMGGRAR